MKKDPKTIPSGPFKGKKIVFASTSGIDQYHDLAQDFLKRILELDYDECSITDESSISDFVDFTEEELGLRIRETYKLDISKIKDGNLLEIFRRIAKRGLH